MMRTSKAGVRGDVEGSTTRVTSSVDRNGGAGISFASIHASTFAVKITGTKIKVMAPGGTDDGVDITVSTPGLTSPIVTTDHCIND